MIGQLAPTLIAMQDTVHELSETVELLTASVAPLGGLAERLPSGSWPPRPSVGGSAGHGQPARSAHRRRPTTITTTEQCAAPGR